MRAHSTACTHTPKWSSVMIMKIDGSIGFGDTGQVEKQAMGLEEAGYDGAWCPETGHDPFLTLALAAEHTKKMELATGIAVAFARNPMNTAIMSNDLQNISHGRFILGLGSQIKPHIEKRFSMTWSHPAPRMREYILAMRAIWKCWNEGEKLDFRGEFYRHTLMTPFFNPGPNQYGTPKVFLAAVGPVMAEVAGEVADGLLVHAFTTERYLREVTVPAMERGMAKAGKDRKDFEVAYPGFVITGDNDKQVEAAIALVKAQVSFYGSTPAYRPVLEMHGWGDLQTELNRLSKQGQWAQMAELIDDDMLSAFSIWCTPEELPYKIAERFGDVIDRFSFYSMYQMEPEQLSSILDSIKTSNAPGQ